MPESVQRIIDLLGLKPLTIEGGLYRETYRSEEILTHLPERYSSPRTFSTCIYYLLKPGAFSSLHKLASDEIFHFYLGDPVEMLQLYEDGTGRIVRIGNDIENGIYPQVIVPKNIWQGARLIDGGKFALMGTTVAPGFDYSDFIIPNRDEILKQYPEFREKILQLLDS